MTRQEELFFERVSLKMQEDTTLDIEQACRSVLADDQRLFEWTVIAPDAQRKAFIEGLSQRTYHALKGA